VDSSLCVSGCDSLQIFETHQIQRPKCGFDSITDPGETTSTRKRPRFDRPAQVTNSSGQPSDKLSNGNLSAPPELNASDEKTGPFPLPLTLRRAPMEGLMQLETEGTVDYDQETYEK